MVQIFVTSITRLEVLKSRIASVFSQIPDWFRHDIVVPFVVTRASLLLVAWLGFRLVPLPISFPSAWEIGADGSRHVVTDHVSPNIHPWVNMLSRWDAGWYIDIARDGYHYQPGSTGNVAFFPAYPLLLRTLHAVLFLPANDYWWLLTAIVVSNVALLLGLTYFRGLLALDLNDEVAARAIIYLLIFPTTFFFSSVYSESLFFALTVAAFYYARKNRWLLACIFTALATLTRSQGIILILPLLVEYFSQRDFNWRKITWNVTGFALIPAALFAFTIFLRLKFGSWNVMFDVQATWGRHLMWPWYPLVWFWRHAPALSPEHRDKLDFSFLVLLVIGGVCAFRRLRLSYSVYIWTAAVFFSCWGMFGSIPRFDLVIFPLFIVFALINNSTFRLGYMIVSTALAALFMVMHSQWNWVA